MFVPNRFLTVKEQILLLSTMVIVLLGIGTLFFYKDKASVLSTNPAAVGYKRIVPSSNEKGKLPKLVSHPESRQPPSYPPAEAFIPPGPRPKETEPAPEPVETENPPPLTEYVRETKMAGVAVMGAVNHPGYYQAELSSRLSDVIAQAGNALDTADLSELLLTAQIIDGSTLTVPFFSYVESSSDGLSQRRPEGDHRLNPAAYLRRPPPVSVATSSSRSASSSERNSSGKESAATGLSADGLLNINTATAAELQQLPGIGAVLSAAIVAEREKGDFSSPDELTRVPGIGAKRLEAIRDLITAR